MKDNIVQKKSVCSTCSTQNEADKALVIKDKLNENGEAKSLHIIDSKMTGKICKLSKQNKNNFQ